MDHLAQHIECLIFTSPEPISQKEIKSCLEQSFDLKFKKKQLDSALEELMTKYSEGDYSFEIKEIAEGFQFFTKGIYHQTVGTLLKQTTKKRLSRAAMETLAIIAYKQPVTRSQLENIRGVSCDYAIQKLLEKELISIAGRSEGPGRPLVYATSEKFMDYFGLKSMNDLPKLKDFKLPENYVGEAAPIEESVPGEKAKSAPKTLREMALEIEAKLVEVDKDAPEKGLSFIAAEFPIEDIAVTDMIIQNLDEIMWAAEMDEQIEDAAIIVSAVDTIIAPKNKVKQKRKKTKKEDKVKTEPKAKAITKINEPLPESKVETGLANEDTPETTEEIIEQNEQESEKEEANISASDIAGTAFIATTLGGVIANGESTSEEAIAPEAASNHLNEIENIGTVDLIINEMDTNPALPLEVVNATDTFDEEIKNEIAQENEIDQIDNIVDSSIEEKMMEATTTIADSETIETPLEADITSSSPIVDEPKQEETQIDKESIIEQLISKEKETTIETDETSVTTAETILDTDIEANISKESIEINEETVSTESNTENLISDALPTNEDALSTETEKIVDTDTNAAKESIEINEETVSTESNTETTISEALPTNENALSTETEKIIAPLTNTKPESTVINLEDQVISGEEE